MGWRYDHTHFKCSDPEKTAAFFREHFGATELGRADVGGMSIITLDIGGLAYNFSPPRAGEVVETNGPAVQYGVYHIALQTEDLAAEASRMKARGVKFTVDVKAGSAPGVKMAFIEGPDGISIELLQRS
jgi:catechol 2,3-dioxygenase-like lactoylglutathione lyase family enzyme